MQPTRKESEVSILKGKTAVVTGSTSGIGLGCARAFTAQPIAFGMTIRANGGDCVFLRVREEVPRNA